MSETSLPLPVAATQPDRDHVTHEVQTDEQALQAQALINRYALAAGGIGVVPMPFFDQVAVGALCGKMIYDLGQVYQVPTPRYRVKATVAAVLGGAHTQWITFYALGAAAVLIPGVGTLASLTVRPAIAGAIAYTVGSIFMRQFAQGKTLENFDKAAAKREFARGYAEGQAFMREQLANKAKGNTMAAPAVDNQVVAANTPVPSTISQALPATMVNVPAPTATVVEPAMQKSATGAAQTDATASTNAQSLPVTPATPVAEKKMAETGAGKSNTSMNKQPIAAQAVLTPPMANNTQASPTSFVQAPQSTSVSSQTTPPTADPVTPVKKAMPSQPDQTQPT